MIAYLAAPLFSEAERQLNELMCKVIEEGLTVYLPQRDGPLIEYEIAQGADPDQVRRLAFETDIEAIRGCDILIAILDGRAIDEGVCIEIGFAKALGKYVVGFKSDIRCALPWGNNPMIDGSIDIWVDSLEKLRIFILEASQRFNY